MAAVWMVAKGLLPLVGLLGYALTLAREAAISPTVALVVTVSGAAVTMVLAGIINLLPLFALLIPMVGLLLLLRLLVLKRFPKQALLHPGMLFFLLLLLFLAWRLHGAATNRYDDLRHWLLLAKQISLSGRLPDAGTPLIHFTSYPPASAVLIYLFTRFTGFREDIALFVHMAAMLVFVLPLFDLLPQKNRLLCALLLASGLLAMLSHLSAFGSLQVDDPLALVALGGVLVAYSQRDRFLKALVCAVPVMLYLVLIKNSGFFFAVTIALSLLLFSRDASLRFRKKALLASLGLLLAAGAFALWMAHVGAAFPQGRAHEHAVDLSAYAGKLSGWGKGELGSLFTRVMGRLFSFGTPGFLILLWQGLLAFLLCLPFLKTSRAARRLLLAIPLIFLVLLLWGVSLFLVYAFSMTRLEADYLTSFSRYAATGVLLGLGLFTLLHLVALRLWQGEGKTPGFPGKWWAALPLFALPILIFILSLPGLAFYLAPPNPPHPLRVFVRRAAPLISQEEAQDILVVAEEETAWIQFAANYELMRPTRSIMTLARPDRPSDEEIVLDSRQADVALVASTNEALLDAFTDGAWPAGQGAQLFLQSDPAFLGIYPPRVEAPQPVASPEPGGILLSWQEVEGALSYAVSLWDDGEWTPLVLDLKDTQYLFSDAVPGQEYAFLVQAMDASGRFSGNGRFRLVKASPLP